MADRALVDVEHLYRYYGPLCAVTDVSFQVARGEVLGFLGINGAGKSTTMQVIAGCLAPSAGRVLIDGHDLLDEPRAAKTALGYLPERPPLYRELTVNEYLDYCARLRGVPKRRITAALAQTKERCGLTGVSGRLIGNLSKGYQQRVGIAQAILHSPAVVILDEPTVGLDPLQMREIRALVRKLATEHAIILSTHILPDVQATCDRVQIIHQGRLVASDTMEGLTQHLETSALIVGLRRPPPLEVLGTMPGVLQTETLEDGRLRLRHRLGNSPAEALAEYAVTNSWGLYELTPERSTLEEVFVAITHNTNQLPTEGEKASAPLEAAA
ncbi:ABC-2 type transport system ATP-binding protein [Gammaproteobacteria bacterium]